MINRNTIIVAALVVLALGFSYFGALDTSPDVEAVTGDSESYSLPEGFVMPALAGDAAAGARDFETRCQSCHGPAATGTDNGPPLVHKIYEPGHHGDQAFVVAALMGVRQHHWNFGNMPPVDGATADEVNRIIAYVRALQQANGIN